MAEIPVDEKRTDIIIDRWVEGLENEPPRPYMGVSMIGHKCPRYLWLNFRWAVREKFPGRMLRLFRRGQKEEERFVEYLKGIGCTVTDYCDNQCEVDFGGWVKGHPDAIIQEGLPEAPKARHIVEFKTHNDKSFQELKKKGVKEAKYRHWAQMQCYMLNKDIDRALYLAVNKNDDELYSERVKLDKVAAVDLVKRGEDIAVDPFMPQGISTDPTWYECKCCSCYEFCHVTHQSMEVNCRTCIHAFFDENGTVYCMKYKMDVPVDCQYSGCEEYSRHPDLGVNDV